MATCTDPEELLCLAMQIVEVIDPMARQDRLDALLKKYHASRKNRVLVFVLYKKEASRIETFLERRGWKVWERPHFNLFPHHPYPSLGRVATKDSNEDVNPC